MTKAAEYFQQSLSILKVIDGDTAQQKVAKMEVVLEKISEIL